MLAIWNTGPPQSAQQRAGGGAPAFSGHGLSLLVRMSHREPTWLQRRLGRAVEPRNVGECRLWQHIAGYGIKETRVNSVRKRSPTKYNGKETHKVTGTLWAKKGLCWLLCVHVAITRRSVVGFVCMGGQALPPKVTTC